MFRYGRAAMFEVGQPCGQDPEAFGPPPLGALGELWAGTCVIHTKAVTEATRWVRSPRAKKMAKEDG